MRFAGALWVFYKVVWTCHAWIGASITSKQKYLYICHTSTFEAAPSDCDVSSPLPSSLHLGSPHLFASHRYGSGSAICWPSMGSLGLSIREKTHNQKTLLTGSYFMLFHLSHLLYQRTVECWVVQMLSFVWWKTLGQRFLDIKLPQYHRRPSFMS